MKIEKQIYLLFCVSMPQSNISSFPKGGLISEIFTFAKNLPKDVPKTIL